MIPSGWLRSWATGGPSRLVAGLALSVAILAAACGPGAGGASSSTATTGPSSATAPATPAPVTLTVFAAASLKSALTAAASAYQAASGNAIELSTDSSAALRTQIEQGAAVDVFLSADTKNPAALATAGLVDGNVANFAGNTLAIVVPKDNPARIQTPFDLARTGLKVIAAADSVPITAYATTLVANLAHLPGAPAGLAAAYAANVVSREDNVAAVLAKIGLGEGDAGIVYASDAAGATGVASIAIPSGSNVIATYAGAVPTAATYPAEGHAFLTWLAGADGQAILATFGFSAVP